MTKPKVVLGEAEDLCDRVLNVDFGLSNKDATHTVIIRSLHATV